MSTKAAVADLICRVRRDNDTWLCVDVFDHVAEPYALLGDAPSVGSFVSATREGDAVRVVECLAVAGTARAAVFEIAVKSGLDPRFPPAVMREVSRLVAAPGVDDRALEDRLDLPLVTIDDATSRDLDQAVCVERDGEDYVVWYALADAAHFVRPGSELYAEALRRGASFYLPDLMIPMLPRALSEGIVSLNPDVERRALLFRIELNRQGALGGTTVSRARISIPGMKAASGLPFLSTP